MRKRDERPFTGVSINIWNRATYGHALVKNEYHFEYKWHFIFWNPWLSSLLFYSVSGNANSMLLTVLIISLYKFVSIWLQFTSTCVALVSMCYWLRFVFYSEMPVKVSSFWRSSNAQSKTSNFSYFAYRNGIDKSCKPTYNFVCFLHSYLHL
jgi:hypothetical protein